MGPDAQASDAQQEIRHTSRIRRGDARFPTQNVPKCWPKYCDSVTDNFCVINQRIFGVWRERGKFNNLAKKITNPRRNHLANGDGSNACNGYGKKTVTTETSRIEADIPRDWLATFDPN
jgi:hypothetical protein